MTVALKVVYFEDRTRMRDRRRYVKVHKISKVAGYRAMLWHKTGGRKAGTPNRRTADIEEKLAALGCDPIEGMAKIAIDETRDISLRAQMFKELAQYVAPKRKAVEVSGSDGGAIKLEYSDEARIRALTAFLEKTGAFGGEKQ